MVRRIRKVYLIPREIPPSNGEVDSSMLMVKYHDYLQLFKQKIKIFVCCDMKIKYCCNVLQHELTDNNPPNDKTYSLRRKQNKNKNREKNNKNKNIFNTHTFNVNDIYYTYIHLAF